MKYSCSGVILAGGLNLRFSGENKALLYVGGKRILDHILDIYSQIFEEILLVTNDPLLYVGWDIHIVTDIFHLQSPLTGIHAGLFHSTAPYGFFTACDTPFIKRDLIEAMIAGIESKSDVIVPETSKGLQPLFAVYSKQCLQPIESHLVGQNNNSQSSGLLQPGLKTQHFYKKVRVKKITEEACREKDPDLVSFFNINTPEDLFQAEKLVQYIP